MNLHWEHPFALLLLGILPLAFWMRRKGRFPALGFARFPIARKLPRSLRQRLLPLLGILDALIMIALAFALARPFTLREVTGRYRGADILLCMDTSSSMSAKDMVPRKTRLRIAKDAAKEFVRVRGSDRIGLLGFARYPDLLCPPTLDHFALAQWIEGMRVVSPDGDEDLTGIGTALAKAALVLSSSLPSGPMAVGSAPKEPPNLENRRNKAVPRIVILLTDGRETVANTEGQGELHPRQAAQLCRSLGIRLYTIALGRKEQGQGHTRPPYDKATLEAIARIGGGASFEARDGKALSAIYDRIDQLEAKERDKPLLERVEQFRLFLLAAIALLGLRILLGATYLEVRR